MGIAANALMREAAKTGAGSETLDILMVHAGLGLLASFCLLSLGFCVCFGNLVADLDCDPLDHCHGLRNDAVIA